MMIFLLLFMATTIWSCSSGSSEPERNPSEVIMKLGGDNCEFYLGAVEAAFKKLKGVKKVDLTTQKGHAIVNTDGTLKTSQVVDSVDGLSGEGWKCQAELL